MPGALLGITVLQVALLACIAIIDLKRRTIHSGVLLALAGLSLFSALANNHPVLPSALVGALFAGGAFGLAYQGGRLFGRQIDAPPETIVFGKGDVWLGTVCGLAVGFPGALAVVLLAMLFGGLSAGVYVAVFSWTGRGYQPFTALPYGQNIALATLAVMISPIHFFAIGHS
ncbi:MAG: prepilin peptidase [Chloroflexi bacterium]|nr:prepilin peptidase [Chloroflexota bacterium]